VSDQTGIVTQFTIKAYPIGKVWGGTRIYDESKTEELYKAMHEFIPYSNENPKAAIIVTSLILTGGSKLNLLFYFYDGEKPPTSGPFADLLKIKTTLSTTKTQSYPDLVCQLNTRGLQYIVTNMPTSSNRTEPEFRY
jgi:hypothetical protein